MHLRCQGVFASKSVMFGETQSRVNLETHKVDLMDNSI